MRVALLGDVHANLPALEAVLADARRRGAEAVWNVGDWVGYNAFPDEVVHRLRAEAAVSIVGNYDLNVLAYPRRSEAWRARKHPDKLTAFRWAWESLSEESRAYLSALPREVRLTVEGWRVLLTHGSPASIDEHLYPETPEHRLAELAGVAKADVVVCGHSHRPFFRRAAGVWWINTGSVGRQDDGDPRAVYAFAVLGEGTLEVEHHRIVYNIERAVQGLREHGLPPAFEEMVRRGRKLKWVLRHRRREASPAPSLPREPAP